MYTKDNRRVYKGEVAFFCDSRLCGYDLRGATIREQHLIEKIRYTHTHTHTWWKDVT